MIKRRRVKQQFSLEERLARESKAAREKARFLPPGRDREILLRRARQHELAASLSEWLRSPGLRRPT